MIHAERAGSCRLTQIASAASWAIQADWRVHLQRLTGCRLQQRKYPCSKHILPSQGYDNYVFRILANAHLPSLTATRLGVLRGGFGHRFA